MSGGSRLAWGFLVFSVLTSNMLLCVTAGSITVGHGTIDGHSWTQYLLNWMVDHFGGNVALVNGAVPGTPSAYMSVWCVSWGSFSLHQRHGSWVISGLPPRRLVLLGMSGPWRMPRMRQR